MVGSSLYVKKLSPEQRSAVRAFVNLECLGLAPAKVWMHRATPELATRLIEVSRAMKIELQGVDVEKVGDDDSHPFLSAKMPVITIHSVTQETLSILHSSRDDLKAVQADYYYDAYRLTAFYLAYLDNVLQ